MIKVIKRPAYIEQEVQITELAKITPIYKAIIYTEQKRGSGHNVQTFWYVGYIRENKILPAIHSMCTNLTEYNVVVHTRDNRIYDIVPQKNTQNVRWMIELVKVV